MPVSSIAGRSPALPPAGTPPPPPPTTNATSAPTAAARPASSSTRNDQRRPRRGLARGAHPFLFLKGAAAFLKMKPLARECRAIGAPPRRPLYPVRGRALHARIVFGGEAPPGPGAGVVAAQDVAPPPAPR